MPKITKNCLVCGKEFKTYKKNQKACSQKCGSKAASKTMKKNGTYDRIMKKLNKDRLLGYSECNHCGEKFKIKDARHDKYCSVKCSDDSRYETTNCNCCGKQIKYLYKKPDYCSYKCKAKDNPRKCLYCGKFFINLSGALQKYCSEKCRIKSNNPSVLKTNECETIVCERCGKEFKCNYYANLRIYCDKCQEKVIKERKRERKNRRKARKRKAKTEKFKRIEIFERDNWNCQICGEKVDKELEYPHPKSASLDHIIPLAKGGDHIKKNVQLAHFICNSIKGDKGQDQLRLFG